MKLQILDRQFDKVINSAFITASTDYDFALHKLVPLINKLDFQRNPLRASFYKRLEKDIIGGCIMPPLTVAIRVEKNIMPELSTIDDEYLKINLEKAFILDGIQRLTTLKRIGQENLIDLKRTLYINILICDSMDHLLYRMITLNNGQKPMTARHQIEILASNIFDFKSLPILSISEKQSKKNNKKTEERMSKEVLIKGYLAFISNSINIDNQKIIESKMDELIAEQIMESNLMDRDIEFQEVVEYINTFLSSSILKEWFLIANNFIGFSAAMSISFKIIKTMTLYEIELAVELFEKAFSAIDVSKIKLGLSRRKMVKYYFEKIDSLKELSENKLLDIISQEI